MRNDNPAESKAKFGSTENKIYKLEMDIISLDIFFTSAILPISDECSNSTVCQENDINKECSSGSCICKIGYYADNIGTCVELGKMSHRHAILAANWPQT